jgi:hypothetical protein
VLTRSQEADHGDWAKDEMTVSANATTAPDGTLTADKIIPSVVSANHNLRRFTAGIYKGAKFSAYCKAAGYRYVVVKGPYSISGANTAIVDLNDGSVTQPNVGVPAIVVESVGSGWYRITAESTDESAFGRVDVRIFNAATGDITTNWSGNGTDGIYVWGMQMTVLPCSDTTYYPTVASAYFAPRIDYNPATLAARGLLVEEARTNVLLRSAEFNNAVWATGNNTVTADQDTAPDSTVSADLITLTNSTHNPHQLISGLTASTAYTFSFFVKRGTATDLKYSVYDNSNAADIVASTSYFSQTNSSTYSRISVTFTTPVGCTAVRVYHARDSGVTGTYYIWGAQLEAGSFPTSYIPTTSASVTRAADAPDIATTLFPYSATLGTLYASCMFMSVAALARALNLDDGTANERVTLGISAAAAGLLNVVDGGTEQAGASGITSGTFVALTAAKIAASWAANDLAVTKDAAAPTTDASATLPTMTTLRLGSGPSAAAPINGWLRQVVHLPRAMSDAELQTLTT